MNSIQRLTELFTEFPGIGPRQARRFVYYLLTRNPAHIEEIIKNIRDLKSSIKECVSCHQFFQPTQSGDTTSITECEICRNPNRDNTSLIIVSRDVDLQNIEKTHSFNGKYFILGGTVPILEKNPEQRVRSKELYSLVEKRAATPDALKEIIVAMNLTPEGESTGEYVESLLRPLIAQHSIKISHLGRGISTGTELEYSDSDTIKNALKNRQ